MEDMYIVREYAFPKILGGFNIANLTLFTLSSNFWGII